MNYEANKTQWKVGDLVLHDADAKRPEMLMKVVGYARDGRCKTKYAEANQMNGDALRLKMRQKPEVWENGIRVLHDPARFGVSVVPPNDPSSATRPTRASDCNLDAMAGFAAAHG